jgi:hypothetical protein
MVESEVVETLEHCASTSSIPHLLVCPPRPLLLHLNVMLDLTHAKYEVEEFP